jgi:hypothetical protein
MYGAVSRGHRGITALVCDTARITNGITARITVGITARITRRITACVTRRITEHDAIGLDAEAAWIPIGLNSSLWDESVIRKQQNCGQRYLQTVSNR